MAEIKIEKRKPIWPWIIALLIIGGIIYYIYCVDHDVKGERNVEIQDTTAVDNTVDTTAVNTVDTTTVK
ncbi:hypothetical protein [Flavobacterium daemonense]|uniref:hypothetical protein n=1 Tax=Flavobacterium daemonense TaxID=1393049 RepID=UPI0011850431|nr:hypothetical protein [Flavobacterium daemonense]KAF2336972.1 hypothetical protein FND99_00770 [Flavobacterium daemonense]